MPVLAFRRPLPLLRVSSPLPPTLAAGDHVPPSIVVLTRLSVLVVATRTYTRAVVVRSLGKDDILMIAALASLSLPLPLSISLSSPSSNTYV